MNLDYVVLSRQQAANQLCRPGNRFRWLISIGSPTGYASTKPPHGYHTIADEKRLRLEFDDVTSEASEAAGYVRASREQIERLVKFCGRIDGPTLIHCEAGISRSSASAIVLGAVKLGKGKELEAVQKLMQHEIERETTNEDDFGFCPNSWIIELADSILEREGKLMEATKRFYPRYDF